MFDKLDDLLARYEEIMNELNEPTVTNNQDRFRKLMKEQSDLFESIEGRFEYIVSNPPYIRKDMIPTLMEEVRDHEPLIALDGGEDGLDFYRKITREATEHLYSGGMLFFEIGYDQGEAVKNLLLEDGYADVEVHQDLAGLDRVVTGCMLSEDKH